MFDMSSPNITDPLTGLQNWIANQVKEKPYLEKQLEKKISLPFGTDAMRGVGTKKKKVKQYFSPHMARGLKGGDEKFEVSIDRETGESEPPGPPPAGREHLKWNSKTHRWIDPEKQAQEAKTEKRMSETAALTPKKPKEGLLRRKTKEEMRGSIAGKLLSDLSKKSVKKRK